MFGNVRMSLHVLFPFFFNEHLFSVNNVSPLRLYLLGRNYNAFVEDVVDGFANFVGAPWPFLFEGRSKQPIRQLTIYPSPQEQHF